MWSVGAVTGGALGAGAAALEVPVLAHLGAVAATVVLAALVVARRLLPGHDDGVVTAAATALPEQPAGLRPEAWGRPEAPPPAGAGQAPARPGRLLARVALPVVVLGAVACPAQVMEDVGGTWSAVYLRTELGAAAGLAGLGFVALQGAQTVGRLLADGLVTRWGDVVCARVGAAVAGTAMAVALALADPVVTVVAFGVVGLGIGTIIPAAMRAADAVPGLRPGTGLTAVSTVLRAGGLVAAPLIGAVADATSLRLALGLVPLLALVVVLLAGALRGGHGGGQTKTAAVHRCSSA
jgi:hypothetical protein